jgi:hypothetical protein
MGKGAALDIMIEEGYANIKSEAIRFAILDFGEKRVNEWLLVMKKLDTIDNEIRGGRRRVLNTRQALGIYAKHVK